MQADLLPSRRPQLVTIARASDHLQGKVHLAWWGAAKLWDGILNHRSRDLSALDPKKKRMDSSINLAIRMSILPWGLHRIHLGSIISTCQCTMTFKGDSISSSFCDMLTQGVSPYRWLTQVPPLSPQVTTTIFTHLCRESLEGSHLSEPLAFTKACAHSSLQCWGPPLDDRSILKGTSGISPVESWPRGTRRPPLSCPGLSYGQCPTYTLGVCLGLSIPASAL